MGLKFDLKPTRLSAGTAHVSSDMSDDVSKILDKHRRIRFVHENGTFRIEDPHDTIGIADILKTDSGSIIDYNSEQPFDEFTKKVLGRRHDDEDA